MQGDCCGVVLCWQIWIVEIDYGVVFGVVQGFGFGSQGIVWLFDLDGNVYCFQGFLLVIFDVMGFVGYL